jgi:hypothetical protein
MTANVSLRVADLTLRGQATAPPLPVAGEYRLFVDSSGVPVLKLLKPDGSSISYSAGGGGGTLQGAYDGSSSPVRIVEDNTRGSLILRANPAGNSPLRIEDNAGNVGAWFDADGSLRTGAIYSDIAVSNSLLIEGGAPNSGANVGIKIHNATDLTGSTKIVSFGSNSVEKSAIFNDGSFLGPGATLTRDGLATLTATSALLQNTTPATGGAPTQVSPGLAFEARYWNSAASTVWGARLYEKPSASNSRLYIQLANDGGAYGDIGWFGHGYLTSGFGIGDAGGANWLDFGGGASGATAIRVVAAGFSHSVFDGGGLYPYSDLGVPTGKSTNRWSAVHARTYFVGNAGGAGNAGTGILSISNAVTVPATDPTAGGYLYVEGGALKYRGSSGTITTVAPA